MNKIFAICLLLITFACERTPVLEASEAMVGEWLHFSDEDDSHRVVVSPDGTGYMEWFVDGKKSLTTKMREWFLDNNRISFGKVAFNGQAYDVDQFPKTAFDEKINFHDTVPEGARYIILDGNYYTEQ